MDKQYAEQVLKEFVERDRMLRKNSVKSDYDKFCETTCRAIEVILSENKELKSKLSDSIAKSLIKELIVELKIKEKQARVLISKSLVNTVESNAIQNKIDILEKLLWEEK